MAHGRSKERGYILLSVGISLIVLIGAVGLAVDLGRMYITKGEAQTYADSAALAAVLELDSTEAGIVRAKNAVAANTNRNNFSTAAFTGTVLEFAQAKTGPWMTDPSNDGVGFSLARVQATVSVPLYFLRVAVSKTSTDVAALAVAGQVPKTEFAQGLFPFSPYAPQPGAPPDFGFNLGSQYTLRWPSNPKLGTGGNVCDGDRTLGQIAMAQAAGGSERGYIEETSANVIERTIINDFQSIFRVVGDLVNLTGGAKQDQLNSLHTRILQDSDTTATRYADYRGNGRRIIAAPVNDGGSPLGSNNRIVGIGAFFLIPTGEYGNGGNQAWCAEYIGCFLQGSTRRCAVGGGTTAAGAYVARLVQ